ncbi:MAG: histidine kinase [Betaproteobacteria bacterium]
MDIRNPDSAVAGTDDYVHRQRGRHPLEIIPVFQRIPPGPLRDIVYTLIWNTLFALFFTLLSRIFIPESSVLRTFGICMLIANCIGFLIHFSFALLGRWAQGWKARQGAGAITLYYALVSVACVFGGYWIAFTIMQWGEAKQYMFSAEGAVPIVLLSLFISAVLSSIFLMRERRARAEASFQSERARGEAAERQFHLARFKLLEAQVEPHFLYNTLANVISMIDAEPQTAKRMLERLIDYLRGTAVSAGTGDSTLGGQLALLRAYLDLIVLRMGSRLRYRIDVPAELESVQLPPMLIQPLVENAIKHGLEPKVGGGEVLVRARHREGVLTLEVSDDGLGVQGTRDGGSTGIGLANLRERLATLYGSQARLMLEDANPGTRATLVLPQSAFSPAAKVPS